MTRAQEVRRRAQPRPEVAGLNAYRLRQTAAVKLNQNESPFDYPEELKAEVLCRVAARPWHRYPPVDSAALRLSLARFCGSGAEMIAVTNGSNEAILGLVEAFASGRRVVLAVPGYSMFAPLAVAGGAAVGTVHLRPDFSLDVDAIVQAAARSPDAAMVLLASPNNPTGNVFDRPAVRAILEAARGLVVIDEAYWAFAGESWLPEVSRYPHLAVLRTFSKAFALAGARVGWIGANEEIITTVRKVLPPYNLNVFAQEAALVALEHPEAVRARVDLIVRERNRMSAAMRVIEGIRPYPSATNFILFRSAVSAGVLFERLLQRGVLVRDVSAAPLLDRCLRVTVGMPKENDRFLQALDESVGVPE
ncbi:MAG: histidinol-phosphate transaminase [Armatimonadetes bacterium]|nr:histidinol-phosphate transaminase [Armatimonadota bacterium]